MSTSTRTSGRSTKGAKESSSNEKQKATKAQNSTKPRSSQKKQPTADQIAIASLHDNSELLIDKNRIKQVMDVTSKDEEQVVIALQLNENSVSEAIAYLMDKADKEWHTIKKKERVPNTHGNGTAPATANGGKEDFETWDEKAPGGSAAGQNNFAARDGRRGGRGRGQGQSSRGSGGGRWRGARDGESGQLADGDGGNRDFRPRGGRMVNGSSRGRGGSRGVRGGSGRQSVPRTYQSRDNRVAPPDQGGFPNQIDTWANPESSNTNTSAVDEFPSPEDWDNEEYTGSLADTKVFTPSAPPEQVALSVTSSTFVIESATFVPSSDNNANVQEIDEAASFEAILKAAGMSTSQQPSKSGTAQNSPSSVPSMVASSNQLSLAQQEYLSQLTAQSSENRKQMGSPQQTGPIPLSQIVQQQKPQPSAVYNSAQHNAAPPSYAATAAAAPQPSSQSFASVAMSQSSYSAPGPTRHSPTYQNPSSAAANATSGTYNGGTVEFTSSTYRDVANNYGVGDTTGVALPQRAKPAQQTQRVSQPSTPTKQPPSQQSSSQVNEGTSMGSGSSGSVENASSPNASRMNSMLSNMQFTSMEFSRSGDQFGIASTNDDLSTDTALAAALSANKYSATSVAQNSQNAGVASIPTNVSNRSAVEIQMKSFSPSPQKQPSTAGPTAGSASSMMEQNQHSSSMLSQSSGGNAAGPGNDIYGNAMAPDTLSAACLQQDLKNTTADVSSLSSYGISQDPSSNTGSVPSAPTGPPAQQQLQQQPAYHSQQQLNYQKNVSGASVYHPSSAQLTTTYSNASYGQPSQVITTTSNNMYIAGSQQQQQSGGQSYVPSGGSSFSMYGNSVPGGGSSSGTQAASATSAGSSSNGSSAHHSIYQQQQNANATSYQGAPPPLTMSSLGSYLSSPYPSSIVPPYQAASVTCMAQASAYLGSQYGSVSYPNMGGATTYSATPFYNTYGNMTNSVQSPVVTVAQTSHRQLQQQTVTAAGTASKESHMSQSYDGNSGTAVSTSTVSSSVPPSVSSIVNSVANLSLTTASATSVTSSSRMSGGSSATSTTVPPGSAGGGRSSLSASSANMMPSIPPGVPPLVGHQYIMSQGTMPMYQPATFLNYDDLQYLHRSLHHPMPAGYLDVNYAAATNMSAASGRGDGGLGTAPPPYSSLSDGRYTRPDNTTSPLAGVPPSLSQQSAAPAAHQQALLNPLMQTYAAAACFYPPYQQYTAPMYQVTPTPPTTGHGPSVGSSSSQFGSRSQGVGGGYSGSSGHYAATAYDPMTGVNQAAGPADYSAGAAVNTGVRSNPSSGASGYSGSQQSKGGTAVPGTVTGVGQNQSGTSIPVDQSVNMYNAGASKQMNKTYEKQTFHSNAAALAAAAAAAQFGVHGGSAAGLAGSGSGGSAYGAPHMYMTNVASNPTGGPSMPPHLMQQQQQHHHQDSSDMRTTGMNDRNYFMGGSRHYR